MEKIVAKKHSGQSHMHGASRHQYGERTHGQTHYGTLGMYGQRRARHFALPANARRDVWRRRAEAQE